METPKNEPAVLDTQPAEADSYSAPEVFTDERNFLRRGLALGTTALALAGGGLAYKAMESNNSIDKAEARTPRYRYSDRQNNFVSTSSGYNVRDCERLNVGGGTLFTLTGLPHRYGSIEQQSTRTRVGSRTLHVSTQLRDVNFDMPRSYTAEFYYGCTYLTKSQTSLQLLKKTRHNHRVRPIGEPKTIEYQENPRVFHKKEFITKNFNTRFILPHKLTAKDLKRGSYCLRIAQHSESVTRPWNQNEVEADGFTLNDPNSQTGMLDQGNINPKPMTKKFIKCITSTKQKTLKPQKDSPWAR